MRSATQQKGQMHGMVMEETRQGISLKTQKKTRKQPPVPLCLN